MDAMREADRVMEDAAKRRVPDVDDVLVAPTVVGGQLYVLAAEERGLKEGMFVLGRGLDKGRVGAEVFVKVCFLRSRSYLTWEGKWTGNV
jgi:ESCRT-I complex subunit TSG101